MRAVISLLEKFDWILYRLKLRYRLIFKHGEELNRRAEIEAELLQISEGKKPLPTREECRIMALKLGTPKSQWSEKWK